MPFSSNKSCKKSILYQNFNLSFAKIVNLPVSNNFDSFSENYFLRKIAILAGKVAFYY